jgi:uncharacterized protein (TIGR03435 family)
LALPAKLKGEESGLPDRVLALGCAHKIRCCTRTAIAALICLMAIDQPGGGRLRAQGAANQQLQLRVPQWQMDAGGQAKFDIASIKQNKSPAGDNQYTNVPLSFDDSFSPTGGLFSATNQRLVWYIGFAYKLTIYQGGMLASQFPKWQNDRYDIQARVSGNPTKDQFRLMLQALLVDRFKLAVHWQTREVSVFAMVLDKPGKLGPQLRLHLSEPPCAVGVPFPGAVYAPPPTLVAGGFPESCGVSIFWTDSGLFHIGGRNMTTATIASRLTGTDNMDRPVLDETGLKGEYDFAYKFAPQNMGPQPPGATFQLDPAGPTLQEALKAQLGIKLEPKTAPVNVLIIDHIEEPIPN